MRDTRLGSIAKGSVRPVVVVAVGAEIVDQRLGGSGRGRCGDAADRPLGDGIVGREALMAVSARRLGPVNYGVPGRDAWVT